MIVLYSLCLQIISGLAAAQKPLTLAVLLSNVSPANRLRWSMLTGRQSMLPKAYIPLRRKKGALGPGVGLAPQRHYFALVTNMLVSENAKICLSPDAKRKICVSPDAKPQRQPVEYRLHWVPGVGSLRWVFALGMYISYFLC